MSDLEDSNFETPQNSESEDEKQTPVQVQQVLDYFHDSPAANTRSTQKTDQFQKHFKAIIFGKSPTKMPPKIDMPVPLEEPEFENPLDTFFKGEPTQIEEDTPKVVPINLPPTQDNANELKKIHYFNRLKKDRSYIYSSITKMTTSIKNIMKDATEADWKRLEKRAEDANKNLWTITKELSDTMIPIKPEEHEKAAKYSATLEANIAKIKAHIRALDTGINACIYATAKALHLESDDEDAGDDEAAAAAADPDNVTKTMLQTLINLNRKIAKTTPVAKKPDSDYRSITTSRRPSKLNMIGET